jgi:hypothetical protein
MTTCAAEVALSPPACVGLRVGTGPEVPAGSSDGHFHVPRSVVGDQHSAVFCGDLQFVSSTQWVMGSRVISFAPSPYCTMSRLPSSRICTTSSLASCIWEETTSDLAVGSRVMAWSRVRGRVPLCVGPGRFLVAVHFAELAAWVGAVLGRGAPRSAAGAVPRRRSAQTVTTFSFTDPGKKSCPGGCGSATLVTTLLTGDPITELGDDVDPAGCGSRTSRARSTTFVGLDRRSTGVDRRSLGTGVDLA